MTTDTWNTGLVQSSPNSLNIMNFDGISSVITIDLKRVKQIEKRMMTHNNNRIGFQSDDEITTEEQIIYNYTVQSFLQWCILDPD